MNKLASAEKIVSISAIEGADQIEKATVLGWEVVIAKKEGFKVGDLVAYINIDTVVPDKPEFQFLSERKFRVKTIKLRKQISQGLIVPLPKGNWKEGDDLTEVLGITKYEKPDNNPVFLYEKVRVPQKGWKRWKYLFLFNIWYKAFPFLRPKLRSGFPTHLVSITDETRIQNIPGVLKQYEGKMFVVSHKLDGSSITIIHTKVLNKHRFRICSRRFELHDKSNEWYKAFKETAIEQDILKLVKHYSTNDIIVQGECIGRFNGNHHNLQQDEIRLFNIYVNGKRLLPQEFEQVCLEQNIPHCPVYKKITLSHRCGGVGMALRG